VPVYPLKAVIPLAAAFLLLQGLAEVIRCVICMRDGRWPARLHDVEEMETAVLHEQEDRARAAAETGPEVTR
jgi:TRAP-type mannitol/chloroaromatic compound transport system permease small subunit